MKLVIYRDQRGRTLDGYLVFVADEKGETLADVHNLIHKELAEGNYGKVAVFNVELEWGDVGEVYTLHPYQDKMEEARPSISSPALNNPTHSYRS